MKKNKCKYKVGDLYPVWWSTNNVDKDGTNMATIIEVRPYDGLYTNYYNYILKLSATNTRKGWIEISVE